MFTKLQSVPLEKIYLYVALFFGMMFVFLSPPFQIPDEGAHYMKALSLAQGELNCSEPVFVPANYVSLPSDMQLVKIQGEEHKKVSGSKMMQSFTSTASTEKVAVSSAICGSSPLGHLIQAVGLKIGIITHTSPLIAFYLGRIFTLLFAVGCIYLAIKIAPFGKIIFLLIGFLPSVVQQLASLSYDAPHIGLVLLFTAYVLKLANESETLTVKQQWLLFVLSLVALNVKPGYFVLCFLVFILSRGQFENTRRYWTYTIGFVLLNILFFLLLRVIFSGSEIGVYAKGVDPNAQLWGVITNPIHFLYIVFHSVYRGFFFYFETFFLKPGWLNTSLPDLLYVFMTFGMVYILRSNDEEINLSVRQRLVLLGVFLAQFFLVFLSMYLVWTKVDAGRIQGVQGRYFLAIAPLLFFSLYKSPFTFRSDWIKKNISLSVIVFVVIVFLFVIQNIVQLYYKDMLSYF